MFSIRTGRLARSLGGFVVVALMAAGLASASATAAGAAAVLQVPGGHATIGAAIDAASPGDTIEVAPGAYLELVDFQGKDLRLVSTGGPAVTTIDGELRGTTVHIGPGGAIEGFTVTRGSASFGAGMSVRGTGTRIEGNEFVGNRQAAGGYGAAIGGNGASPVIVGNRFRDNSCDAQFLSGVVSFVNGSSPLISHNVFVDNRCRAINMTLPEGSQPLVVNNTMVGNDVGIRVDTRMRTSQQVFRNNIIFRNGIGLETDFLRSGNEPTFDHNIVAQNTVNYEGIAGWNGRDGNRAADPLFVDLAGRDLHLKWDSTAIDSGSADDVLALDIDGDPRPVDGDRDGIAAVDQGADEFVPSDLRIEDARVVEGNDGTTPLVFTVRLTSPARHDVTVPFRTIERRATAGVDFVAVSGTVTIPADLTEAALVIDVLGDTTPESWESLWVRLSWGPGIEIVDGFGVGYILDDDRT